MELPKKIFKGFVYLNIEHPLVAWECYRGALISSYKNASNQVIDMSLFMANKISSGDNINLANELLFENVRLQYYPMVVSRLKCLYVFDNEHSAIAAQSWDEHFKSENLVELGVGAYNDTKVDANWVTFAERDKSGLIKSDYISSIKRYWSGEPYPNKTPHWEVLVEGYGIVWGIEHKQRAYQIIKEVMPKCLGLLEISRIAESMGFYLGHIFPHISRLSPSVYKLSYMMDMHELNDNYGAFIERLEQYKGPINYADAAQLFDEQKRLIITAGDLREYEKNFSISQTNLHNYNGWKTHTI